MSVFHSDFQCSVSVSQKANIDSGYLLQCQKLNHMVGEGKGKGGSVLQMEDCVHYSGFNIACIHGSNALQFGKASQAQLLFGRMNERHLTESVCETISLTSETLQKLL